MGNPTQTPVTLGSGQILIVPRGSGITNEDKKALKEIGVHVVTMRFTERARLLTAERLPIDSNGLLIAVLKQISDLAGYEGIKAKCFTAICKAIEANTHE